MGFLSTQWYFFKFNFEIPIVDAISLVVTIVLGVFLATRITSRLSAKRFLIELLIEDVKEARRSMGKIKITVAPLKYTLDEILPVLREFSAKISDLELFATETKICDKGHFKQFQSKIIVLRTLLTSESQRGNTYSLSSINKRKVDKSLKDLEAEIVKLVIHINSY